MEVVADLLQAALGGVDSQERTPDAGVLVDALGSVCASAVAECDAAALEVADCNHRHPRRQENHGPDLVTAVADGGTILKVHDGWMWDLTVPGNGDHDFYVEPATVLPPTRAGPTGVPVLVHNDSCPVFRGTTKGFDGSAGTQRVGVTPTSSDPGVATIFATHSQQFGDAVVQIATPEDIAGVETFPGCIASEAEIGVDMSPAEFAVRASTEIPVGAAREILSGMGIDVPSRIGIGIGDLSGS